MTSYILFVLAFLICNYAILAGTYTRQHTYWQLRERLLVHEKRQSLGGELKLGPVEIMANYVLMAAKNKEINDGSILYLWPVALTRQVRALVRENARYRLLIFIIFLAKIAQLFNLTSRCNINGNIFSNIIVFIVIIGQIYEYFRRCFMEKHKIFINLV